MSSPRTAKQIQENLRLLQVYKDNPHTTRGSKAALQILNRHEKELNYIIKKRKIRGFSAKEEFKQLVHEYWLDKMRKYNPEKPLHFHYYLRRGADLVFLRECKKKKTQDSLRANIITNLRTQKEYDTNDLSFENECSTSRWCLLSEVLESSEVLKENTQLSAFLKGMCLGKKPEDFWKVGEKGSVEAKMRQALSHLKRIMNKHPEIAAQLQEEYNAAKTSQSLILDDDS